MAAVANVQTVNITINDVPVAVPKGEMVIESIKRLGLDVPIFCYHPRMKPVGMCRMCLIEIGTKGPDGSVRMMPKPQTACSLPATEGLVIVTDSEKIHKDRRGVLEFLLINHPLDCPICDRGGECPLQNNTLFYGPSTSRYIEVKRHAPKAFPLSQYVTLDLERCIQCGRCVRFTEEISGDAQLAFRFRGASMQPSTFELRDFSSKFSGNVIEICPVGALTNSEYRFRARPWDLETRSAICTRCGNGCNIHFDHRGSTMVRINGRVNEAVNEEWTCDKGKFGHEFYNSDNRLTQVLVRKGENLEPSDWQTAYFEIVSAFANGGKSVAGLGGSQNSNEDLFLFQRLFRGAFGSGNLDHRFEKTLPEGADHLSAKFGQPFRPSLIASLESRKSILMFGTDLSDDAPIVYLRARKAWLQNGAKIIAASSYPIDADGFAQLVLRYKPGTEEALLSGLAAAVGVKGADARFTPESVAETTGVSASAILEAAQILKDSKPAVLTSRSIYNAANAIAVEELLANLALSTGGDYDCYGRAANDAGAALLGIQPLAKGALNTHQILQACAKGSIRSLWLLGVDPFQLYDRKLVEKALESVEFLVVQDCLETEAAAFASVVLPMTAPAEADGSWTNVEQRVQRLEQVLPARGVAKPAWQAFMEIDIRTRRQPPFYSAGEVMQTIAKEVPAFAGCGYEKLDGEGFVLG